MEKRSELFKKWKVSDKKKKQDDGNENRMLTLNKRAFVESRHAQLRKWRLAPPLERRGKVSTTAEGCSRCTLLLH